MVSVDPYLLLLALIAVQRLVELLITRRHTRDALALGGIEYGQGHFGWMRLLHAAFLVSCAAEVVWLHRPFTPALGLPMLALVLAAQALRWWTMRSLGPWWNARVVVVPGMRVVTRGPYRYHRHPNYVAVGVEGFAIPLVHGAWITALVFSLANALLLLVRIRCEEHALLRHTDYGERFGLDAGLAAEDGA